MENECLFAILSNEDELVLRKNLRLLSPRICSGFCFIIRSSHYDQTYMEKVSAGPHTAGLSLPEGALS